MMKKKHIFSIILIIVTTALVALINGHFKKAVCESNLNSEVFGIYTATLYGKNMKPLITNSWQQMTHARVSPDKKWVTFTRYTNRGKDGCATENEANYERKGQQYLGTEVLIMRIDGTDVRTLIPHQKDKTAANSYWTPDGKGLIYVSAPNEKGRSQINHIILDDNMRVKEITKLPIPDHIIPTDPHWVGEWVVFPAMDIRKRKRGIWRMRYDGSGLELLAQTPKKAEMQDNDPKLSPDASKVAFMRKMKEGPFFHVVVVDVNTKEERDFSSGYLPQETRAAADFPPEWSSDGKLLIFSHILADEKKAVSEMHTIKPDGTGRKRVPLPRNYVYFHTSFFPGEGSGKEARIIFSTRKIGTSDKKPPAKGTTTRGSYERINIIGETANRGVFDPALEYNEDGSIGWMVYSALEQPPEKVNRPFPKYIHTHLAKTLDNGKTWEFIKCLNESKEDTVVIEDSIDPRVVKMAKINNGRIKGTWRHEVATLVHDPDDPGKEWKLFWHKYFSIENPKGGKRMRVMEYSWIMYKCASTPEMLNTAQAVELFGTDITLTRARYNINRMPGLEDSLYCSEPGSLYKDGVLYLSLNSGRMKHDSHKQVLLSSKDHGSTWTYINKLTDYSDAKLLPYSGDAACAALLACTLAEDRGRLFLLSSKATSRGHRGTYIFEFEDITKGKLKRDKAGKLIVHKFLPPSILLPRNNAGESDYDEHNTYGGIIMPQGDPSSFPRLGQIFSTKERIVTSVAYEKINIIGETAKLGTADPSIEYDQNGVGWMSYSGVEQDEEFAYVSTHLAKSTDNGKTWTYVSTINRSTKDTIYPILPVMIKKYGKKIEGTWFHEVPTLVHDPNDPGKEWKLFWHRYFMKPKLGAAGRVLHYGWVAYKYASNPAGKWSEEIPLFGAGALPLKPYKARINLNELHPDLKKFITYTEPGSLIKDDVLYLTLQGHIIKRHIVKRRKNIAHIILIASHDHGKTWRYVDTLLRNKDAQDFGGKYFTGSSLAKEGGRAFLFASPENDEDIKTAHRGTVIFEFEDLTKGTLRRDKKGNLIVHKWLKPTLSRGGQSDYDEQNTYGGIVMPGVDVVNPKIKKRFQIFNTKEGIISRKQLK